MRAFDNNTIRAITAFENITGTEVRDCICGDTIYFLVKPGKAALAIGKGGQMVQTAEKMLGKRIKIIEFSENANGFVKNLIPQAEKVEINGTVATVSIRSKKRGAVIGREGSNIKTLRELLERNCGLKELKIV